MTHEREHGATWGAADLRKAGPKREWIPDSD
jgi:hypothetical protein